MPEIPGAPAPITCPACGFENAAHTLFCQDCGARLPVAPPSYLTPASPASPATPSAPVRKPRILKVHRPGARREFLGITLRVLLYAGCAAISIQMLRPPRTLPPVVQGLSPEAVTQEFDNLTRNAGEGRTVRPTWEFLNAYLAGRLVSVGDASSGFVRATVLPREAGFTLFVHKKAINLPIYTTVDFRVIARTNGLSLEPVGASIGRIALPPWAAGLVLAMNGGLATALSPEIDALRNARDAEISGGAVQLDFSPSSP